MKRIAFLLLAFPALLAGCQSGGGRETLAQLRDVRLEIKEEPIEGGLDKAMEGYQRFLEQTPESALTPAAIRRLADLKVEKEYGYLAAAQAAPAGGVAAAALSKPEPTVSSGGGQPAQGETEADFERRALAGAQTAGPVREAGSEGLERSGTREAIALYQKLLEKYPNYQGNDQVLYQMSRSYEELGETEQAMAVMQRMVKDYPQSRYINEVQFRRAEYFFTHRQYLEAEAVYQGLVDIGPDTSYYELALYKLGWTFYKQELYEEGLHRFIALLDHKVTTGYDFAEAKDDLERKRVDDTFRVVSQSFSYLHGAASAVEYFEKNGKRAYEDRVYSNLGEFYYEKRRYSDAAASYNAFVGRNPFHRVSPQFHMRVIEIHIAGGFPTLVIEAKKEFAKNYGLKAEYWKHFEPAERPEVLGFLKTNFTDLAHHYHALYQDPGHAREKEASFQEALHWYEEFLVSFPKESESAAINYQMADLLMENRSFARAAREYEKTAYDYPRYDKSSAAGYAAVFAYREQLKGAREEEKDTVKREGVRSSLRFADAFPEHEKAAIVLGAAADDLYELKDYEQALTVGRKLIATFPAADKEVLKSAWVVAGHSCYELKKYPEAEAAYVQVLALVPADDKSREGFNDNLAASIYKQGEQANAAKDYRGAADHFLRVGRMAAGSKIRVNAEYDASVALIQLKEWKAATAVLTGFRELFPGHELQPEVTRKLAHVYKEDGQLAQAAGEYERLETEFKDEEVRRESLMLAAELHQQTGNKKQALAVYRRYVGYFPEPVEVNLEMRNKVCEILKEDDRKAYLDELTEMVAIDAAAGPARTPRTKYLAGKGALVLAEQTYERFTEVRLVKPFETNLRKKKELMKATTQAFNKLPQYEVGEVTAAATFYLAEIYGHFSKALTGSERPDDLNPQEMQEYEMALEEQAFPFEEKAISVHEKNMELISLGIYNDWIDKSLGKLAKLLPVRYDKPELPSGLMASLESYSYEIEKPAAAPVPAAGNPVLSDATAPTEPAAAAGNAAEGTTAVPAEGEQGKSAGKGTVEGGAAEGDAATAAAPAEKKEVAPKAVPAKAKKSKQAAKRRAKGGKK
ncbi:tetratricopeptide repeat protein [Geomonas nitrogeniifigens]|uniref:Tetratricopeptide repeat protein n=1 Tax=Geomonas diazotrophica TaxID=2843197 RepID=A0ABX8JIE6_9BACT|nr:tetratricopeptide repeat protein [Geomonas nitrogeniifigens]QWV96931.1 tetratricopeptide repeat protein [Geomonas nitrogeniifigens]